MLKLFDSRWQGTHGIGRFASELFRRLPGFSAVTMSGSPARALDPLFLEQYLRLVRASFFLSPGFNVPLTRNTPFAFCLHDLNHLAADESRSFQKKKYYEWIIRPAVSRATVVFTVSEFSRLEICDWAKVSDECVVNVSNGVSELFRPEGDVYKRGRYFLHVGGTRPHKNLSRVMGALSRTSGLHDVGLICVGGVETEVNGLAREFGLTDRVLSLRSVSDENLAMIYRGAIGLIFVSLREGFGLPIVEAMACGCPVITSRLSAMPEVSGGAALLVDPMQSEEIADKMELLAYNESLRLELRDMGVARASCFSWDVTASRVISALEKILR